MFSSSLLSGLLQLDQIQQGDVLATFVKLLDLEILQDRLSKENR